MLKKKAQNEEGIIVFEDEASFRQNPTLHQTWAPIGRQPKVATKGQRNTQKIFGAIDLYSGKFTYLHQEKYFTYETYILFLNNILRQFYKKNHRVFLIQDNASYHKKSETYDWFKKNRNYIEVTNLPPYYPEYNAIERIWNYTRKDATHNKYFETEQDLCNSLYTTFEDIKKHPKKIMSLLHPFF